MKTVHEVPAPSIPVLLNFKSDVYTIKGLASTCCTTTAVKQTKRACLQALRDGMPRQQIIRALGSGLDELFMTASRFPDVAAQIKALPPDCFNDIMKAILNCPN